MTQLYAIKTGSGKGVTPDVVPPPPLEKEDLEYLASQTNYADAEIKSWHK